MRRWHLGFWQTTGNSVSALNRGGVTGSRCDPGGAQARLPDATRHGGNYEPTQRSLVFSEPFVANAQFAEASEGVFHVGANIDAMSGVASGSSLA